MGGIVYPSCSLECPAIDGTLLDHVMALMHWTDTENDRDGFSLVVNATPEGDGAQFRPVFGKSLGEI